MLKRLLLVAVIALIILCLIFTMISKFVNFIFTLFTTKTTEPAPITHEEILETEPITTEITETPSLETKPIETEPANPKFVYVEQFTEVPLYNQLDYASTTYGYVGSTVASSGCGIACYAMVLSYLLDREILPDELASMYHRYRVEYGSSHSLFIDTQEYWGVSVKKCFWEEAWVDGKVMESLENGQPIIANVHADSVFTENGHFIVLYGLTKDGKILVRDPYGANYNKKGFLADGFKNGFEPKYFRGISADYFIYQAKDLDALAAQAKLLNSASA